MALNNVHLASCQICFRKVIRMLCKLGFIFDQHELTLNF
jgi:hypothetical protein